MTQKRFKTLITNACKNQNFAPPTATAFYNFLDLGLTWQHPYWTDVFKALLHEIENGLNYRKDKDNKTGSCVAYPIADGNSIAWLAVYFNTQDHRIYMIKIETGTDVSDAHLHSLKQ